MFQEMGETIKAYPRFTEIIVDSKIWSEKVYGILP